MNLQEIKTKLQNLDNALFPQSLEIFERNIRIGFSEELSLFGLFVPFIVSRDLDTNTKAVEILKLSGQTDLLNSITDYQSITEIEKLEDKKLKDNFKKSPEKIYEIIFTKITHTRFAIALLSAKVSQINRKEFLPDKKTFFQFVEKIYSPLSQVFGIHAYSMLFDDFLITEKFQIEYKDLLNEAKPHLLRGGKEIEILKGKLEKFRKYSSEIIEGRVKSPTSVFKKVYERKEKLIEIMDFVAIRIVTETIEDCYSWLGYIYANWNPLLSKFKDYIEHPKPNGYKSLHIVILTESGPVEIQIKTHKMHKYNELGVASHWKYKVKESNKIFDKIKSCIGKNISEYGKGNIFVFTPKNDIILLPKDSCIIDFAYAIHSDVGDALSYVEINGRLESLNTKLKDRDVVNCFLDKKKSPNAKWLEWAVSQKAREKISQELHIVRVEKRVKKTLVNEEQIKNLKVAQCCNPFCEDEVGIYKSTKRKSVLHTTECLKKKNKSYKLVDNKVKSYILVNKTIKVKLNEEDFSNVADRLKQLFLLDFLSKDEKEKVCVFKKQIKSREDFEKLKKDLMLDENVESVELVI